MRMSIDLHDLLERACRILRPAFGERVELLLEPDAEWSEIQGDPVRMENAVINLGMNARDAMPAGGTLTLRTENVTLRKEDIAPGEEASPGDFVRLSVIDTGVGIPEDVRERIFEPFFTTKSSEGGTGLGLASAFGCVSSLGGRIRVESEAGVGTTFLLDLPLASAGREHAEPDATGEDELVQGQGTILLAEDEDFVRQVTVDTLSLLGYEVLACADGEEAVAVHAERSDEIDLVMLDMVMPGLNGPEALARIRAADPAVKAVLMTGYSPADVADDMEGMHIEAFVTKPVHAGELSRTLRRVLAGGV
jgi:two-component system cell cycle sensor histidine kinase/response regulator CckA